MQQNPVKNIFTFFKTRAMLVCILLCCNLIIQAQNYRDTTVITEEVIQEPPVEEENDEEEEGVADKSDFLQFAKEDTFSLQVRKLADSLVKKMKADDDFWYADAEFEKKKEKQPATVSPYIPIGQQTWFRTLVWLVIIGVFAAGIMYYLADSNISLFRRNKKVAAVGEEEEMPGDIFAINYEKEIDKAASMGNFRMAVRLMFLRLLKNMSERNIIRYQQDKTNLDYLMQLHSTAYYKDFFRITRNYEYSWYGKFEVSQDAYQFIRNDFEQFENRI